MLFFLGGFFVLFFVVVVFFYHLARTVQCMYARNISVGNIPVYRNVKNVSNYIVYSLFQHFCFCIYWWKIVLAKHFSHFNCAFNSSNIANVSIQVNMYECVHNYDIPYSIFTS